MDRRAPVTAGRGAWLAGAIVGAWLLQVVLGVDAFAAAIVLVLAAVALPVGYRVGSRRARRRRTDG